VGLLGVVAIILSSGGPPHPIPSTTSSSRPARHPTTVVTSTTTTTDPGTQPQTQDEPSLGAPLTRQMTTLFSAITSNTQAQAMTVFFPESAYLQMKTGVLPNPAADYQSRLVAFYDLDLTAYHQHLGDAPTSARLTAVLANPDDAQWIAPGTCENTVGYWHLPGVRLVYLSGGATYSFRVASLISWRGTWYVVHLGPNPRPSNIGTVDDPQSGPGAPGPAGGC